MWRIITSFPRVVRQNIHWSARSTQVHNENEKTSCKSTLSEQCDKHSIGQETRAVCHYSTNTSGKEQWYRNTNNTWNPLKHHNAIFDVIGWGAVVVLGYHLSYIANGNDQNRKKKFRCLYNHFFSPNYRTARSVLPQQRTDNSSNNHEYSFDLEDSHSNLATLKQKSKNESFVKVTDLGSDLSSNSRASEFTHASSSSSSGEAIRARFTPEKPQPTIQSPRIDSEFENAIDYLGRLFNHYNAMQHNIEALKYAQTKDFVSAIACWEKAASLGYAKAEFNLGISLENGRGTDVDPEKAMVFYRSAAEKGHKEAMFNLAILLKNESLTDNREEIYSLLNSAAEKGLKQAKVQLGLMYLDEPYCDHEKAFPNFLSAAEQQVEDGLYYVGLCYQNGWGTAENLCKAAKYFSQAANAGHPDAQFTLASYFEQGLGGLPEDVASAKELYQKAADSNHQQAKHSLNRILAVESLQIWAERYKTIDDCAEMKRIKTNIRHSPSDTTLHKPVTSTLSTSYSSPSLGEHLYSALSLGLSTLNSGGRGDHYRGSDGDSVCSSDDYDLEPGVYTFDDFSSKSSFTIGDDVTAGRNNGFYDNLNLSSDSIVFTDDCL
ncbi:uncharacterized protein LOC141906506 [Tubulanus polymorphus]|uniref:uncharacterized protein LOC141906506 n=1 Tax=Tubulanus polymorphus TaxID=672921 RepID=UPI003DA1E0F9